MTIEGPAVGEATIHGNPADPTITIRDTQDVTLRRLNITEGKFAVLVRRSDGVVIADNFIAQNRLRGVRVVYATAHILNNRITDTYSPYGKGIHIANAMSWPASLIAGNIVERSGGEGIITNMTHVIIRDNIVRNNGLGGIAITEMSMANVENNIVIENVDAGLYVVDMSMAEVEGNRIGGTRPEPFGRAHAIRVEYYAEAQLNGNRLDGGADGSVVWHNGLVEGDVGP